MIVALVLLSTFCSPRMQEEPIRFSLIERTQLLDLSPLPVAPPDTTNRYGADPAAARLGQALFFDERLSGRGDVSCATCHQPERSWTDGLQRGRGIAEVERHTMSLWNVGHNRWFFWDGRKDSLWSQALAPLEDPREHGGSRLQYAHLVLDDPDYRRAYEETFGPAPDLSDGERFPPAGMPMPDSFDHVWNQAWRSMTARDQDTANRVFVNIGKAIAAFERRLVTPPAPFDRFVEGLRTDDPSKLSALTPAAQRGAKLFVGKARCALCHFGSNFTDLEFHNDLVPPLEGEAMLDQARFGGVLLVKTDPFNGLGAYSDDVEGEARNKVAYLIRNSHNVGEFKTPGLRNVALSPPYMHEGQFATLEDVVRFYSTLEGALPLKQAGERLLQKLDLSDSEQADLVAFLHSLTSTGFPEELLRPPSKPYLTD